MKLSRLVLSLLVLALPKPLLAGPDPLEPLRSLAIQDGGRIKPFDTYARETARRVTGAKPFGFQRVMGLDPVEWVLSMMADPDRWRREPGLIRVTHVGLREAAQLPADKDRYSWDELTKHAGLAAAMEKVHEKVRADREAKLDPVEREVSGLEDTLGILDSVFTLSGIRVVPHPTDPRGTWFSLRDLDDADAAPIMTIRTLRDALLRFAKDGDREHVGPAASALSKRLASMAPDTYPAAKDLQREVHYNTFKPFRLAWLLYLLGFFSLLASLTLGGTFLGRAGLGLSFAAFIIHAYGMVIRSLISGRPPVTNMYESVIWVAWGAMLFALIFEAVYRVRFFAACASGVAVISLILADNVPILDGAIDPLVPVLRDNMWLTIHVLTITLAYAAFFLPWPSRTSASASTSSRPDGATSSPRCRCSSIAACRSACCWERPGPCWADGGPRIPGAASGAGTRRRPRSSSPSCSTWPSCTAAWSACSATSGQRWRAFLDSSGCSGPGTG